MFLCCTKKQSIIVSTSNQKDSDIFGFSFLQKQWFPEFLGQEQKILSIFRKFQVFKSYLYFKLLPNDEIIFKAF